MKQRYSHQLTTGISFGLTSGVITALGIIVGLNAATSSRLVVIAGIIVIAIADGLADAAGLHLSEEAELEKGRAKHTHREIWLTTFFTFVSVCGFILSFVIPLWMYPLEIAVFVSIGWGMLLLILVNFYIAKIKRENPIKLILEHMLLALFIIVVSHCVGNLVARWVR